MSFDREEILAACGPGTPEEGEHFLVAADWFLSEGDHALAASALDRAYALLPNDFAVARQRLAILDQLAIEERGLVFRYVPAGSFLMGSASGDPDERPVHARRVRQFWMTDIPITWTAYCRLLGWSPPPDGSPPPSDPSIAGPSRSPPPGFILNEQRKIQLQYCESNDGGARDWHSHAKKASTAYDTKPLVAVSAIDAEELADALSLASEVAHYRLPSEAEWERAARGGLIGCRWSWGDDPPTHERCDFDRFGAFHLTDPRTFAPNGYGLYSMCGGVAEWTADRYDALAYTSTAPSAPPTATDARVVRGGSWADCREATTVSFRASRRQASWRHPEDGLAWGSATVGFRLVRTVVA